MYNTYVCMCAHMHMCTYLCTYACIFVQRTRVHSRHVYYIAVGVEACSIAGEVCFFGLPHVAKHSVAYTCVCIRVYVYVCVSVCV